MVTLQAVAAAQSERGRWRLALDNSAGTGRPHAAWLELAILFLF